MDHIKIIMGNKSTKATENKSTNSITSITKDSQSSLEEMPECCPKLTKTQVMKERKDN